MPRSMMMAAMAAMVLSAPSAMAQEGQTGGPPAVGEQAPDFTLTGATRAGVMAEPVRLSDFRGKTVVLAFFYRARTRG